MNDKNFELHTIGVQTISDNAILFIDDNTLVYGLSGNLIVYDIKDDTIIYKVFLSESMIKTISIEKAKSDPTNSVIYTFTGEDNSLITNINYQNKNILSCIYDDSIHSLNINK